MVPENDALPPDQQGGLDGQPAAQGPERDLADILDALAAIAMIETQ
jgi:hypothetical protein